RQAGARGGLEYVDAPFQDRELDVQEADGVEVPGERHRLPRDFVDDLRGQAERRERGGGVARVDASFLDVLHHATDDVAFAVSDAVDVDFDGVLEDTVDED